MSLTSVRHAICRGHRITRLDNVTKRLSSWRQNRILSPVSSASLHSASPDHVFTCKYPDLDIPESFLPHFLMKDWGKWNNNVALVNGANGAEVTYEELQSQIVRVGSALYRLGYRKGDVMTIISPNCVEYVAFMLGAMSIGMIVSSLNPLYTADELVGTLSNTKLVVFSHLLTKVIETAKQRCSGNVTFMSIADTEGYRSFSTLLDDDGQAFPENIDFDSKSDVVLLPYSSGTTGLSKGVMATSHNMIAGQLQMSSPYFLGVQESDVYICQLPMFHTFGMSIIVMMAMRFGAKVVVMEQFDAVGYLKLIETYKPTMLHLVPPIMLFLGMHPAIPNFDLSSVRTILTAAAPTPVNIIGKVRERLPHVNLTQGFGMTEAGPPITINPTEHVRPDTCGTAVHNTQVKVQDTDSRKWVGPNQEGEVVFRGPQMMKGYLNNEKATSETIVDGWLHTGDIGYMDEEGYLHITDRLKELIKFKGHQVAPAELENLLLTHPAVQDAAVIGKPDDRAGELPRAYVVLKPDSRTGQQEIIDFVKSKAAPHKQLRGGVEFRAEIPRSASGKILRRFLKKELLDNK